MTFIRQWVEPRVLGATAIASGCTWIFAELADAVLENETRHLDSLILMALRSPSDPSLPIGPRWLQDAFRDLTALGSPVVLALLIIAAIVFLLLARQRLAALHVIGSTAGGVLLSMALKRYFSRPRPGFVPDGMVVDPFSFPSGHAMLAAIIYFTLAALIARTLSTQRLKIYLLAVAIVLTALVGVSRVYLGVHWPSDVLGGWAIGAAWALVCWLSAHILGGRILTPRASKP